MMIKKKIQQLAKRYHKDLVHLRRHLHQYPELSFKEKATGRFIAEQLKQLGIVHEYGVAENGTVALIRGKKAEREVVALRADIDALPIQEDNKVAYKSKNEGVMHACGHDVHTASLLGTARILNELKGEFEGTVKLIFQPAEEKLPGGASLMIKEGALEKPRPGSIFGQHVHPPLATGKVGFCPGSYMASADELYVTVKGRGGHGALPHECIDPVAISAQIIVALQQVVSRFSNPITPSVLTFGKINTQGGATNIIPNEVQLVGTFRTMDERWRDEAHKRMKKIATGIAKGMGGACKFKIIKGYPVLHNDEKLTHNARAYAVEYLGQKQVIDLPIRMSSEDFAWYSHELPACFYRLGTGNVKRGITSPVHTSTFDVDEGCLEVGAGLMAWMAIRGLGN
ncbi:MAG: M20 family metallopeptidase [Bacteroidota bacterium]